MYLGWSAVMHNGHIRGKPAPALNKLLISGCEISASLGIDDRTVRLGGLSPGKPSNTKGYDRRGTVGMEKLGEYTLKYIDLLLKYIKGKTPP